MKYIFLAIFVFLSAQPLQASLCDMCDAQGTMIDQHGNNHGDSHDMDCCDQEPASPGGHCDSMTHCGACGVGTVAIAVNPMYLEFATVTNPELSPSDSPQHRSESPPYRPPIG